MANSIGNRTRVACMVWLLLSAATNHLLAAQGVRSRYAPETDTMYRIATVVLSGTVSGTPSGCGAWKPTPASLVRPSCKSLIEIDRVYKGDLEELKTLTISEPWDPQGDRRYVPEDNSYQLMFLCSTSEGLDFCTDDRPLRRISSMKTQGTNLKGWDLLVADIVEGLKDPNPRSSLDNASALALVATDIAHRDELHAVRPSLGDQARYLVDAVLIRGGDFSVGRDDLDFAANSSKRLDDSLVLGALMMSHSPDAMRFVPLLANSDSPYSSYKVAAVQIMKQHPDRSDTDLLLKLQGDSRLEIAIGSEQVLEMKIGKRFSNRIPRGGAAELEEHKREWRAWWNAVSQAPN
jgi:hypothetical protein